jgi:tRNA threonylcarbamoyladenosine biosynthesis protein TsaB
VVPDPADLLRPPAHARELMPALARVVESGSLTFDQIDAVAVGRGPGTFTGLRIGIATARAIAAAWSLPVHGVSSLAALAAGAEEREEGAGPVLAVIDARRGEVFAALYEAGAERLAPFVSRPDELAGRLSAASSTPVAVGDGAVRFRAELESAGARVPPDDSPRHVVRALQVCRLAVSAQPVAPEALLPEYLRQPDAVPQPPRPHRDRR